MALAGLVMHHWSAVAKNLAKFTGSHKQKAVRIQALLQDAHGVWAPLYLLVRIKPMHQPIPHPFLGFSPPPVTQMPHYLLSRFPWTTRLTLIFQDALPTWLFTQHKRHLHLADMTLVNVLLSVLLKPLHLSLSKRTESTRAQAKFEQHTWVPSSVNGFFSTEASTFPQLESQQHQDMRCYALKSQKRKMTNEPKLINRFIINRFVYHMCNHGLLVIINKRDIASFT